jgi:chromosomal replication initiation ATPase DnaA
VVASDHQLALPLARRAPFADFLAAPSNEAARNWLDHLEEWPSGRLVLWGQTGCGKTHLAHHWAGEAALLLDGGAVPALPNLGLYTRLVVDNADHGANDPALLHLLNTCAEAGRSLLLTARSPPSRWGTRLADLGSRLLATQTVAIDPPDDSLLQALLARLLAERQLTVAESVQEWLLQRLPRTAGALQDAAVRLDAASLARRQPITRALARANLSDLLEPMDHDGCDTAASND